MYELPLTKREKGNCSVHNILVL